MSDKLPVYQQEQQIQAFYEDEISLHDLLLVIVRYKKLILLVTIGAAVLAVIVSLLMTPIYQAKVSFLPPSLSTVARLKLAKSAVLDVGGSAKNTAVSGMSREGLYHQFQTQVQSEHIKKEVYDELGIAEDYPSKAFDVAFRLFYESYSLVKPKVKKGEKASDLISLKLEGEKPGQLAEVLNRLVYHADHNIIQQITKELAAVKKAKILRLEESIRGLKKSSVSKLQDEITRIREADRLSINTITKKIQALRLKAKVAKQDRIKVLQEAANIASKIGLFEPYSLKNDGLKIELLDQPKPLYFRGEKALTAEIGELKNRSSDDPFIPGLRGLEEKLELLKENEKIKILLSRKNNDAFITDLRNRELELSRLKAVDIEELKTLHAVTVDQQALPPSKKIKPKRSLIVAIGTLLGLMLGLVIAFLKNYLRENPLDV